jgi:hypothetical protein
MLISVHQMPTAVDGAASTENSPSCEMRMLFFFIQYLWVSKDWNIYSKVALSLQSAASCKKLRGYITECNVRTIRALMRMQKNVWESTGVKHKDVEDKDVEVFAWKLCSVLRRDVCHKLMAGMLFLRRKGKLTPCNLLQMFNEQDYAVNIKLHIRDTFYRGHHQVALILGPHRFTRDGVQCPLMFSFARSGPKGFELKDIFPGLPDHINSDHTQLFLVETSEFGIKFRLNTRLFLCDRLVQETRRKTIYLSWGVIRNADKNHQQTPIKWVLWDTQCTNLHNSLNNDPEHPFPEAAWGRHAAYFLDPFHVPGEFNAAFETKCINLDLNQGDVLVCALGLKYVSEQPLAVRVMHMQFHVGTWAQQRDWDLVADAFKRVTLEQATFAEESVAQYWASTQDRVQYLE